MQAAQSNNQRERFHQGWRDSMLFLLGPGLASLALSLVLERWPPAFPLASQAAALSPPVVTAFLALGGLGVFLSARIGFSGAPATSKRWRSLLFWSVGLGLAVGLVIVAIDAASGMSGAIARKLGIASIHVAFPASLAVYGAIAVVLECAYRLGPIPVACWLIGQLIRGRRAAHAMFWLFAALTSLVEPLQQAALPIGNPPAAAALALVIFAVNLEEAHLFRRFGWPAPVATRLALYLVWHVVWPLAAAPMSAFGAFA